MQCFGNDIHSLSGSLQNGINNYYYITSINYMCMLQLVGLMMTILDNLN